MVRFFTGVAEVDGLFIRKEAGPEIFVQNHTLIVPSGSLEFLPSSKTLSVGKVITWSDPAMEIGGLLFSLQASQEISFLQEKLNCIENSITIAANKIFVFIIPHEWRL